MTGMKPTQFLVTTDDMIAKLEFAKTCLENPMVMETAIDWSIQMITAMQAELAAEKALADRLYDAWHGDEGYIGNPVAAAYRKARGL